MEKSQECFLVICVFFVLSLAATWVLFTYLESFAQIENPTYKLGGGLAGFISTFVVLVKSYSHIVKVSASTVIQEAISGVRRPRIKLRNLAVKIEGVGITLKARRQATKKLKEIERYTRDPTWTLIELGIEIERKLRDLARVSGLSVIEAHRPLTVRNLIKELETSEIITEEWLKNGTLLFWRRYRNAAVHGLEITKKEARIGVRLGTKILAKLNEKLQPIK